MCSSRCGDEIFETKTISNQREIVHKVLNSFRISEPNRIAIRQLGALPQLVQIINSAANEEVLEKVSGSRNTRANRRERREEEKNQPKRRRKKRRGKEGKEEKKKRSREEERREREEKQKNKTSFYFSVGLLIVFVYRIFVC